MTRYTDKKKTYFRFRRNTKFSSKSDEKL